MNFNSSFNDSPVDLSDFFMPIHLDQYIALVLNNLTAVSLSSLKDDSLEKENLILIQANEDYTTEPATSVLDRSVKRLIDGTEKTNQISKFAFENVQDEEVPLVNFNEFVQHFQDPDEEDVEKFLSKDWSYNENFVYSRDIVLQDASPNEEAIHIIAVSSNSSSPSMDNKEIARFQPKAKEKVALEFLMVAILEAAFDAQKTYELTGLHNSSKSYCCTHKFHYGCWNEVEQKINKVQHIGLKNRLSSKKLRFIWKTGISSINKSEIENLFRRYYEGDSFKNIKDDFLRLYRRRKIKVI